MSRLTITKSLRTIGLIFAVGVAALLTPARALALPTPLQATIAPVTSSVSATGTTFTLDGSRSTCPATRTCTYAWSVFGSGFSRLGTPLRQQPGLSTTSAGYYWTDPAMGNPKSIPVIKFTIAKPGVYQFYLVVIENNGMRLAPRSSSSVSVSVK